MDNDEKMFCSICGKEDETRTAYCITHGRVQHTNHKQDEPKSPQTGEELDWKRGLAYLFLIALLGYGMGLISGALSYRWIFCGGS